MENNEMKTDDWNAYAKISVEIVLSWTVTVLEYSNTYNVDVVLDVFNDVF